MQGLCASRAYEVERALNPCNVFHIFLALYSPT